MAYRCLWQLDHGVGCHQWHKDNEDYCVDHQRKMVAIDALEIEINEVIRKAREK